MKTICWDVDDTLNYSTRDWWFYFKSEKNFKNDYRDLKKNPPHKILKISEKEYLKSLDYFRHSNYRFLAPNWDVEDWFEENGNNYEHTILTSTPLDYTSITFNWVFKYFGKWIRSFNFIPSYRERNKHIFMYNNSKGDWLEDNRKNIDIYVDDNKQNCKDAKALGIETYCVKQPWNNGIDIKEILKEL